MDNLFQVTLYILRGATRIHTSTINAGHSPNTYLSSTSPSDPARLPTCNWGGPVVVSVV